MAVKQVLIKGNPIAKEAVGSEAITPGHLLEFLGGSAATASQLKKHATARGNCQPAMFANIQDYIGGGLSKAYASGDQVMYFVPRKGDEINALLKASENAGVGSYLESAGDGTLQVHTPASAGAAPVQKESLVGRALDSSNVGTVARIRVEVL